MPGINIRQRRRVSSFKSHHEATSPLQVKPHHSFYRMSTSASTPDLNASARSSSESLQYTDGSSSEISEGPLTPDSTSLFKGTQVPHDVAEVTLSHSSREHPASTRLVTQDPELLRQSTDPQVSGAQLFSNYCCGGQCLLPQERQRVLASPLYPPLKPPQNDAFKSLNLHVRDLNEGSPLTNTTALPECTVSLTAQPSSGHQSTVLKHPPRFVQPHPPYHVFSAPLFHARELTKPGAEKRTFHFDVDVTDYPEEAGVDFKVGGAIGVCPPNNPDSVNELLSLLGVPTYARDKPITLHTSSGRWPTIWGEEEARELTTTRRELLTWCSDIQSYPPTKAFLRLLAEHASDKAEQKILFYLASAEGQADYCDLRTGPHLTISQMLHAFPSAKPPLEHLLSILPQLMPRFYSLSNDPHVSSEREGLSGRRLIEIAVTVHETADWKGGERTGAGSGFLERLAKQFIEAEAKHKVDPESNPIPDLRIPLFRGLMANPLSKEFGATDGPMMLIGAGVGMAPFRGFILNRLKNANCASKIWLVQGIRDASVDELYQGELGQYEDQIKRVVESRGGGHRKKTHHHVSNATHLSEKARKMSTIERGHSESDLTSLAEEAEHKAAVEEERKQRRETKKLERERSRQLSMRLQEHAGLSPAAPVENAHLPTPKFKLPFEPEYQAPAPQTNGFSHINGDHHDAPETPIVPGAFPKTPKSPELRSKTVPASTRQPMQKPIKEMLSPMPSVAVEDEPSSAGVSTPVRESRYVQDEVRAQADIVWDVIMAVDGRIFVCGSSAGMGKGVEDALHAIALERAGFEGTEDEKNEGAKRFWDEMKEKGKYVVETW